MKNIRSILLFLTLLVVVSLLLTSQAKSQEKMIASGFGELTEFEVGCVELLKEQVEDTSFKAKIMSTISLPDSVIGSLILKALGTPSPFTFDLPETKKFFDKISQINGSELARVEEIYSSLITAVPTFDSNREIFNGNQSLLNTFEDTLISGKALCRDYSIILIAALNESGIKSRMIFGDHHAWIRVTTISGEEFDLDPTWYKDFVPLYPRGSGSYGVLGLSPADPNTCYTPFSLPTQDDVVESGTCDLPSPLVNNVTKNPTDSAQDPLPTPTATISSSGDFTYDQINADGSISKVFVKGELGEDPDGVRIEGLTLDGVRIEGLTLSVQPSEMHEMITSLGLENFMAFGAPGESYLYYPSKDYAEVIWDASSEAYPPIPSTSTRSKGLPESVTGEFVREETINGINTLVYEYKQAYYGEVEESVTQWIWKEKNLVLQTRFSINGEISEQRNFKYFLDLPDTLFTLPSGTPFYNDNTETLVEFAIRAGKCIEFGWQEFCEEIRKAEAEAKNKGILLE